jgi:hypothetical protein
MAFLRRKQVFKPPTKLINPNIFQEFKRGCKIIFSNNCMLSFTTSKRNKTSGAPELFHYHPHRFEFSGHKSKLLE